MMPEKRRIAIAIEIDQPYPHHQDTFHGIRRFAREHPAWECVIDEHPGYAPHRRPMTSGYDGVIARVTPELQRRMKNAGVPLVNVMYEYSRPGLAGVYADPCQMGRIAAEHLIDRGFQRLVVLFNEVSQHAFRIATNFKDAAEQAGVECRMVEIKEGFYYDESAWSRLEKTILTTLGSITPPTAIFVRAAEVARLIVQYAEAMQINVPTDLAVMSVHNIESIVSIPPQITSVDMNYERVGYEAAALLERLINGEAVPDSPTLIPPRGIAGRETTDYFAVEDDLVGSTLRYISKHLNGKLRVQDIAYDLNVSTRLLQIRFSKALGVGISAEIRRLRFEKAKRLLAEPDKPIGSIPKQVGFATPYVMNQIFRRELGMTPGAYRNQALGKGKV